MKEDPLTVLRNVYKSLYPNKKIKLEDKEK